MKKHCLEKGNKKVTSKILKVIFFLTLAFLIIYNITLLVQKFITPEKIPSFVGYKNFVIVSGSMEPELNIGDIVFVKEDNNINVGDIISFNVDGAIVTHRVIEIIEQESEIYYKTKGDANNAVDTELNLYKNIEGKYSFKIPKIGKVVMFLQSKFGIVTILVLLLGVYFFIPHKEEKHFITKGKHRK